MAKGRYNISVSNDSNLVEKGKNNYENQECMNSCLGSTFLRSLSLHDRPRSSKIRTNKELPRSRFRALVSTSLEKISSNTSPPSEVRSESSSSCTSQSAGINAEAAVTTQPSINNALSSAAHQETDHNRLSGPDSWLEDGYRRFSAESEELLEKTVSILRTVDKEISESLANLTKPQSIALESVMENYRNKGRNDTGSTGVEFDLLTESSSDPIYENWQPFILQKPKDAQAQSTPRRTKNVQTRSSQQSPKNTQTESTQQSLRLLQTQSSQQSLQNIKTYSTQQSPKNFPTHSAEQIPKHLQAHSVQTESLSNLKKPESIALESVREICRNKGRINIDCSAGAEFNLSKESSSHPIYENWQPFIQQKLKDVQAQSTPRKPEDLEACSPQQSPENTRVQSSQQNGKNLKSHPVQQNSKTLKAQSSQQSPTNRKTHSVQESPKNLLSNSAQQSPKNLKSRSVQQRPTKAKTVSIDQILKNMPTHSTQQSPKSSPTNLPQQSPQNLKAHSMPQNPKNLQAQFSKQNPENLLFPSVQETLKNFESLRSNSENMQSLTKPDSADVRSVEQSPRNLLPSPNIGASDDTTKVKFLMEFDLPTDHEQFIKIIGALQNRCLEYREMTQDIAVSALKECLNFSESSLGRIRHLRRQFERQKRNFGDFKELCSKSVVFGPNSLPIDEKVTEVIQSFYLKLLQEENETFMARLEFGLKMVEVYAKMLKLETEKKKIITTFEKEILYLKKTSVGFKV